MVVALGVGQAFQREDRDAFAPRRAVGRGGECLAAPVSGQSTLPAELDEHRGRRHDGRPAGEGEFALAVAQRLHGEVDGHQGRRARRVDGDRGSVQSEAVGDTTGGDAHRGAGDEVAREFLGRGAARPCRVVDPGQTGEDADLPAVHGSRIDAGVLEGLPARLEQESLLRVHRQCFARRDAEDLRVETRRIVEKAAVHRVRPAGLPARRIVEIRRFPTAVRGECGDGLRTGFHQVPQVLWGADPAGEPAPHPDDGDRLAAHPFDLAKLLPGLIELCGHPFQIVEELRIIGHNRAPIREPSCLRRELDGIRRPPTRTQRSARASVTGAACETTVGAPRTNTVRSARGPPRPSDRVVRRALAAHRRGPTDTYPQGTSGPRLWRWASLRMSGHRAGCQGTEPDVRAPSVGAAPPDSVPPAAAGSGRRPGAACAGASRRPAPEVLSSSTSPRPPVSPSAVPPFRRDKPTAHQPSTFAWRTP